MQTEINIWSVWLSVVGFFFCKSEEFLCHSKQHKCLSSVCKKKKNIASKFVTAASEFVVFNNQHFQFFWTVSGAEADQQPVDYCDTCIACLVIWEDWKLYYLWVELSYMANELFTVVHHPASALFARDVDCPGFLFLVVVFVYLFSWLTGQLSEMLD